MPNIINKCNIYKYNADNLKKCLKNKYISLDEIENEKRHFTYLLEYLGGPADGFPYGLGAGMIIQELEYTSRSYLDDYQEHYFLAYKPYDRYCTRIHFFKHEISDQVEDNAEKKQELFKELLSNEGSEIWEGYLGYIVRRPLPTGIIGATLLETYSTNKNSVEDARKYTVTKNYKINVFGVERKINTLIYVEQDRIVGACATSALYVSFHRLSHLFNCTRPNQKKISDAAGMSFKSPNRKLMNKEGLSTFQMCKVIEKFGLEPEIYSLKKRSINDVKSIIYSYLKMGLPVIVGIKFDDKIINGYNDNEDEVKEDGKKKKQKDLNHAITFTGYTDLTEDQIEYGSYLNSGVIAKIKACVGKGDKLPLQIKAHQLKRFYAHDDQIGPFARIGFNDNKMITAWWDKEKEVSDKLEALPWVSIIPISHRIRIPYEKVIKNVELVNIWLHTVIDQLDNVTWDIYLSRSNKEKKNVLNSNEYDYELHNDFLSSNLPKYLWVADCCLPGSMIFKIIFDASDINDRFSAWNIIYQNIDFKEGLHEYCSQVLTRDAVEQNVTYVRDIIETTGIEVSNLFLRSLDLPEFEI